MTPPIASLTDRLLEGCVLRPKRWSGDTHDDLGGSIDEEATDALMREAAATLSANAQQQGEAAAWLHTVVQDDGEQDQALSFSPDSFPLEGVGGFRSIGKTPLYAAPPPLP